MGYLWLTALIWALSIALIGGHLAGTDIAFVSWARMSLALGLFALWCRPRVVSLATALKLAGIGAVQYGLMFLLYMAAFQTLKAYEVALFTITTPFWVVLLSDSRKKTFRPWFWAAVVLSVIGAWLLQSERALPWSWVKGLLLVQSADLCFAWGQLAYRRLRRAQPELSDARVYAFVYLGAWLLTLAALCAFGRWDAWRTLSAAQWGVLLWLGLVSSGLGLFLWNKGAVRTNPGSLAAANNLKIPLTVAVTWLCFGELPQGVSATHFVVGTALIMTGMALPFLTGTHTKKETPN